MCGNPCRIAALIARDLQRSYVPLMTAAIDSKLSAPQALHEPPLLAPGARIALVAPAGPLNNAMELAHAESNARALGWDPVIGEHALSRSG